MSLIGLRRTASIVVLAVANVVAASDLPYRLAGIIAPDEGDVIALIELPDGEQHLVRTGDAVGNATVTAVTRTSVRLRFPDGDMLLELTESTRARTVPAKALASGPIRLDAASRARIRSLATRTDQMESESLSRQLLAELALPAGSRISAVDDRPVADTEEAIAAMANEFSRESGGDGALRFVLSVDAPGEGPRRIYVFADNDGSLGTEETRAD